MRIVIVIFVMLIQCLGFIQPGIYSQPLDLHKMYAQCSDEDPDITPVDFVFEHLLNLEDATHCFEDEDEEEEGERPHEPFQITHNTSNYIVAFPKTIEISLTPDFAFAGKVDYPTNRDNFYYFNFNTNIFRPPIV